MDQPLLKSAAGRGAIAGRAAVANCQALAGCTAIAGAAPLTLWSTMAGWTAMAGFAGALAMGGCSLFNDSLNELDPALRDSTLILLPASEHRPVARRHILESFGSFGCVSCPEAEARLAQYIHPELGSPGYNPDLIVINYHVKFGSISDPWVTPAIQAWNDRNGYVSLPQAVMDGSNARYGIREKDVSFKEGEYDSLAARAKRSPADTWLDLRLDSSGIAYDTAAGRIRFRFEVRNLDVTSAGALDFRVLVVKNKSAIIPIYPTPWEVIVMETGDTGADGLKLALPGLSALTAKAFNVDLSVPSETGKHVRPPPKGPETLTDYALVMLARDANGTVLNVAACKYRPK